MTKIAKPVGALVASAVLATTSLAPGIGWACACGCGVFDVGTSAMLPTGSGGTAYIEYDFMDQNRNWSGTAAAPASNNDDKEIRSHFFTAGFQYMIDHDWGVMADIPFWDRTFRTTDDGGNVVSFRHADLGDVRIRGMYTGFSADMSSGVTFGLKLPTGNYTYPNFDRDTAIGTGSVDALLGAFGQGALTDEQSWTWFVQGNLDVPMLTQGDYRPGGEIDAAAGTYYRGWSLGGDVRLTPVVQTIASYRFRDRGAAGLPNDSGYRRLLLSPGLELDMGDFRVYGDVEVPVYQQVNGNQLTAEILSKVILAYRF